MAKSSPDGTIHCFISFRVTGDQLVPAEMTEIIGIAPITSYKKNADYSLEHCATPIKGKTGVWYFSTDKIVSSTKMSDHLTFLLGILCPEGALWGDLFPVTSNLPLGKKVIIKLSRLREVLRKRDLKASMTIFWHGVAGARPPVVPRIVASLFRQIPIEIETDFEAEEGRQVA